MRLVRFFLFLLLLWSTNAMISQELKWEWASFATSKVESLHFENISCGYHNNLYAACPYDSLLVVGDTIIRHPEMYGGSPVNYAVIEYDSHGDYVNIIDIYTLPGSNIYNTFTGVDENENLYIASTFSRRAFIQDTIINHCNTPYIYSPDGLIVQLDKYKKINWARTIGGTLSDQIYDLIVSKTGDSYILSEQTASSNYHTVVDFFQQDSVFAEDGFMSVSNLNNNGILIWRNDFYGEFASTHLVLGKDMLLYMWGGAQSDVIINNDTIIKPGGPNESRYFIGCIDTTGDLLKFEFVDFPDYTKCLEVNSSGNIFISGIIYDTLIIGTDTTIVPQNLMYRFIEMFNSQYQPGWYHIIPTVANQQLGTIVMETDGEDLAFSSYSNRNVQIADTVLVISGNYEAFTGVFDKDGNLKDITMSNTNGDFWAYDMILDKCNNPILACGIRGKIYLNDDTASTFSASVYDGALVKIIRNCPPPLYMGPDTSSCNGYLLVGPQGYQQYSLNDSLISQNFCMITKTGSYVFGCSYEGCWVYDTVFIEIQSGFIFNIGIDTTIFSNDTIIFSIPAIYDSIKWFDGSDSVINIFYAKDYQPGVIPVWAEVFTGPCSDIDTLLLNIISDFGVEDIKCLGLTVYPNPFHDTFTIEPSVSIKKISLFDNKGNLCYSKAIHNETTKVLVNPAGLKKGIYILKVITRDDSGMIIKIVKL